MLFLLNSLPNAILIPEAGEVREIKGISESEAIALWNSAAVSQSNSALCSFDQTLLTPQR